MKNKKLVNIILILLVLQFILGILANLYSKVPSQKPYEVFHQFGFISLHALNGTLLLVLGIILVVKFRKQTNLKLAAGGLVNLILAFTFGEFFVFTQRTIFSFLMALGFIGALLLYAKIAFMHS
jgi:hypothetical protein